MSCEWLSLQLHHFFSLVQILEAVRDVQNTILEGEPRLRTALVPTSTLHITLAVAHLPCPQTVGLCDSLKKPYRTCTHLFWLTGPTGCWRIASSSSPGWRVPSWRSIFLKWAISITKLFTLESNNKVSIILTVSTTCYDKDAVLLELRW